MALQVTNYQLPQGVALPAAYLKISEAAVRTQDNPDGTSSAIVTIFFKIYKDAVSRQSGVPSFPDTPFVSLANPVLTAGATDIMTQLYDGLAQGLGVPNVMV